MDIPNSELEAVGRDAHAVIDDAKASGVYVFGGGIDVSVEPVLVNSNGEVTEGGFLGHLNWTEVSLCWNCRRDRMQSTGRLGSLRRVGAIRNYESFSSTLNPEKLSLMHNMKLRLTNEPVTPLACASSTPDPLHSLTRC